ncbi:hypothetical protein DFJ43DRAFT_1173055 [Lentinula guzmanii]|uniref:Fungal-type protein kinase domain-containing protein n=1 Tax=Lentinula guzmanii TaxID=2804957 RepID=A0AA38N2Q2_9AGAR|nr:hypothetical protein DFJ43DRAFT_1173055 [Lentinula guzmanii]
MAITILSVVAIIGKKLANQFPVVSLIQTGLFLPIVQFAPTDTTVLFFVLFRSTWELTKCMLDAIKAHRDTVLNTKMGRLQETSLTGNFPRAVRKRETGHMSGQVPFSSWPLNFSKECTARTVGDDLESFMLVFLWLAAHYTPNKMSPAYRGKMLYTYDTLNQLIRENVMLVGSAIPGRFQLHSTSSTKILVKLVQQYSARYAMPYDNNKALESDIIKKQAMLETHGWMIDTMQEALKDEDWNAATDGAQRQDCTPPTIAKTV